MTTRWTTLAIIVLSNISLFVNQRICQEVCGVILDAGSEFETYYDDTGHMTFLTFCNPADRLLSPFIFINSFFS